MSSVVKVGTLGLVDDAFGEQAAADAATQAGQLQADAARAGEQGINDRFNQTRDDFANVRNTGDAARDQQANLLGLNGTGAQQTATNAIQESPSQQFLRKRAERSLLQNSAAIGGIGGGNVRSDLVQQGVGFAQQDLDNQFNRLGSLSGAGNVATSNVGTLGSNAAQGAANMGQRAAEAQASGILGAGQAKANATNQFIGAGFAGASLLSDENAKTDIHDLTHEECHDIVMDFDMKTWRYLDEIGLGDDYHVGPMAQQVPDIAKLDGKEMLNMHSMIMLVAGALQHEHKLRLLDNAQPEVIH